MCTWGYFGSSVKETIMTHMGSRQECRGALEEIVGATQVRKLKMYSR